MVTALPGRAARLPEDVRMCKGREVGAFGSPFGLPFLLPLLCATYVATAVSCLLEIGNPFGEGCEPLGAAANLGLTIRLQRVSLHCKRVS